MMMNGSIRVMSMHYADIPDTFFGVDDGIDSVVASVGHVVVNSSRAVVVASFGESVIPATAVVVGSAKLVANSILRERYLSATQCMMTCIPCFFMFCCCCFVFHFGLAAMDVYPIPLFNFSKN